MRPLGVILAGGESRRYGAPKALATVGGQRIIDRAAGALRAACEDVVIIANDPDLFRDLGMRSRPDERTGLGALGGIHAALRWAEEEARPGIVAVACDMPFLSVPLLRRLRDLAFPASGGSEVGSPADVVLPESRGRRGVEPLCGAYATACLAAIEAEFDRGDSHMIGFHEDVTVRRLPLAEVEELCDPESAFMNVNTPEERERAERLAGETSHG